MCISWVSEVAAAMTCHLAAHLTGDVLDCAYRQLQAKGDPAHVQLLYERALAVFPVTTYLWQAYAYYMQDHIKVPAATNSVYSRAVRNCPWVGTLWANALRALELHSICDEQQHASLYSSALQAGLQMAEDYMEVVLARLDGLRHMSTDSKPALRQGFQQAAELMQTYFPDYIDRSLRLHAYWADCEVHIGKDEAGGVAVWEDVLKGPMARYIEPWIAYVTMLVTSQNHAQARRVFKRGHSRNMQENGQVFLCEAWLRFEREHGTAESFAEVSCCPGPVKHCRLAGLSSDCGSCLKGVAAVVSFRDIKHASTQVAFGPSMFRSSNPILDPLGC